MDGKCECVWEGMNCMQQQLPVTVSTQAAHINHREFWCCEVGPVVAVCIACMFHVCDAVMW